MILRRFATASRLAPYYITTPIFYVNAAPHIGHVYSALIADVQGRWRRMEGRDVIVLTGTDEHGLKVQESAAKAGTSPKEFCDDISIKFRNVFDRYEIRYDDFIRTTEERHRESVRHLWNLLVAKGYIYMGKHESWYCVSDESFLTDTQVEDVTDDKGVTRKVSKESRHPVIFISEDNYKFRLSSFQQRLLQWLNDNPSVMVPQSRLNEVKNFISSGLKDLSVSRPAERIQWGIPVPNDSSHVIYVWLDALTNYLTAAGYPGNQDMVRKYWPPNCHVIGKDILKFHAVYWPAFLMAAGLPLPKRIVSHAHWTVDRVKMSKSLGNVVDPFQLVDKYGVDATRFCLLHEGGIKEDCDFSYERMTDLVNSTLADCFGNLCSRSLTRNLLPNGQAVVPHPNHYNETDLQFIATLNDLHGKVSTQYDDHNLSAVIKTILSALRDANQYVTVCEPWTLVPKYNKDGSVKKAGDLHRLATVMYISLEALRICSILLLPIIPGTSNKVLDQLGVKATRRSTGHLVFGLRQGGDQLGDIDNKLICFTKIQKE